MIAIVEATRAGLLTRDSLFKNMVAGVIVGVVALPLAMAFAIASGVRPEQGIYTAIVTGVLVSLFGGSRVQIAGPTGAFIAILAGITAKFGIEGLQVATLMAGALLVIAGITKTGTLVKFIPTPVIAGFTSGIGVVIFVGQWRDFLGLPPVSGAHFHERLWHLTLLIGQLDFLTLGVGLLSLAITLYAGRVKALARVPAPLIAMIAATALQSVAHLPGVATIGSAFGGIPRGLPSFALPSIDLTRTLTLVGPAFTIALLGAIESLLSAVVADGMSGNQHDPNQELIGQGIANLIAPLFGGFAATGAIARTATNIRNGATNPLAGIAHSATLVAVLIFLAPLASAVPLSALAAILFIVAWNMSEPRRFVFILKKAPLADRVILMTTFVLTVFTDLVIAVNVGLFLSMLQFLRRMTQTVETQQVPVKHLRAELEQLGLSELPPNIMVYEIAGPMFFGSVENFKRALLAVHPTLETLVIRLGRVPFMDITGIESLAETIHALRRRGVRVILCEATERVRNKLLQAGVIAAESGGIYVDSLFDALKCADITRVVAR